MIKSDLHTHTVASGHAYHSIEEMAAAASKKGIKILGITEHGPALKGAPVKSYFHCLERMPQTLSGIRILYGVEANIIDAEGNLDLPADVLKKLDIVVAGLHMIPQIEDLESDQHTQALINAIKNPHVKIISHPYQIKFDIDIEKIAQAACDNDVLMELNASYFFKAIKEPERTYDRVKRMVAVVKKNGKRLIINSDAHTCYEIGRTEELLDKFPDLGLTEEDIVNNDLPFLKEFLGIEK